MGTRNYAECQVKQVPSAFNLQHSHGVARQCHRLPRHKPWAAHPGLHTRGCTPRPARPLLNSHTSKASPKTPRPARPLQLLSQQGLYNARPARPLENHPATLALHPQERGLPLRIQGQQVDGATSWPSRGSEGSSAGNPRDSRSEP